MKRFVINTIKYIILLCFVSALFLKLLVSVPNDYTRISYYGVNTMRQIERMKTINGPKIIIIGGSNCAFGLYSPMISKHFDMPVCNTGVHAGIGLETQIDLYKEFIKQGDIILVIPEYEQLISKLYQGSESTLDILTSVYPQGYKSFTFVKQLRMIKFVPKAFHIALLCKGTKPSNDESCTYDPYSFKSLNDYGDVEMFENRHYSDSLGCWSGKWENPELQNGAIKILEAFYDYCMKKKAILLVFPPNYKATYFDSNEEFIQHIWNNMKIKSIPIVSKPERYRIADTLYYDSEYHLIYEGVMIRTNHLIEDMDSALRVIR